MTTRELVVEQIIHWAEVYKAQQCVTLTEMDKHYDDVARVLKWIEERK